MNSVVAIQCFFSPQFFSGFCCTLLYCHMTGFCESAQDSVIIILITPRTSREYSVLPMRGLSHTQFIFIWVSRNLFDTEIIVNSSGLPSQIQRRLNCAKNRITTLALWWERYKALLNIYICICNMFCRFV